MDEEYLKGLHSHLGIKDDYDTWVNAVKDDKEYLTGLHGHLKIEDDYDTWNTAVFGDVKKKEAVLSEATPDQPVVTGEALQEKLEPSVSETPSTIESEPTPEISGSVGLTEARKLKKQKVQLAQIGNEMEKALYEHEGIEIPKTPSKVRATKAETRKGYYDYSKEEAKAEGPLEEDLRKVADNIFGSLSKKYLDNPGGYKKIGGEEYKKDIAMSIPKDSSLNILEKKRIALAVTNSFYTHSGKAKKMQEDEALENEFMSDVGSVTYYNLKDYYTDPQFVGENSSELLTHAEGEPEFLSPDYVYNQYKANNWDFAGRGPKRSEGLVGAISSARGPEDNKEAVYDAWLDGQIAVKNPLSGKYADIANMWLEEDTDRKALEDEALTNYKGATLKDKQDKISLYSDILNKVRTKDVISDENLEALKNDGINTDVNLDRQLVEKIAESNRDIFNHKKSQREWIESDRELGFMLTPEQKTIKKAYDKVRELSKYEGSEEIVEKFNDFINETKGHSGAELFDPNTGKFIKESEASEEVLKWNNGVDKYRVKYSDPSNDRQSLIEARDKTFFEFKALGEQVFKQLREGKIEVPMAESFKMEAELLSPGSMYAKGGILPLWGGSPLLDKYAEKYKELMGMHHAITQNEDPAYAERSWGRSFAKGLASGLGTRVATQDDIIEGYISGARDKGLTISPEQEARLVKTYGEDFFETMGSSLPAMAKIIGVTIATEGTGFVAGAGELFNIARSGVTPMGKAILTAIEKPLISGVQYALADEGFATGVGEGFGAQAYDLSKIPDLIAKSSVGKALKPLINTFLKQVSMGGAETVQEYAGEFAQRVYDNEEFGEALANTIGEDPLRKLALTYQLSFMLGATSSISNYQESVRLMEQEILNTETSDPDIVALQQEIKAKRQKPASRQERKRLELEKELRDKAAELETEETKVQDYVSKPGTPDEEIISPEEEITEEPTEILTEKPTEDVLQTEQTEGERIEKEEAIPEEQQAVSEQEVSREEADVLEGETPEKLVEEEEALEFTTKDTKYKIDEHGDIVHTKGKREGKVVSAPTKRKVLREKAAIDSAKAPKIEVKEGMTEGDVVETIITDSVNPKEVADAIDNNPPAELDHKDMHIANYLPEKLGRQGVVDAIGEGNMSASIAKGYKLSKSDARSLDDVAKEVSLDAGTEITPQDIVDFMLTYPQGTGQFTARINAESVNGRLRQKFTDLTGLDYTGLASKEINKQILENDLAEQFEEYPPEILEELEKDYPNYEAAIEASYQTLVDNSTETEGDVGSTEPVQEGLPEQEVSEPTEEVEFDKATPSSKLHTIADKVLRGESPSLKEVEFAKEQGIDLKKPIEAQIEEAKAKLDESLRKSRGKLNAGLPIDPDSVKNATKLARLHVLNGVKNFKEFIRRTKLKASNWLRKVWDSVHFWRDPSLKFGHLNLESRLSLDNAAEAIGMINQEIKKLAKAESAAAAELAQEAILDKVSDIVHMIDVQMISAKSKSAKANLQNSRDYVVDLYQRIKKQTPSEIALIIGNELKQIKEAKDSEIRLVMKLRDFPLTLLQDAKRPQEVIEKWISAKEGRTIKVSESAIEMFDLAKSMAEAQNKKIEEYVFGGRGKTKESLLSRMKKEGLTEDNLGLFMYAQHAKERNARMAALQQIEVNKKIDAINENDAYSKEEKVKEIQDVIDTNPINEAGSGMTNDEAADFIQEFKDDGKFEALEKYSAEFKANVTDKIAENLHKGGVITEEQYKNLVEGKDDATGKPFKHYAPLKIEGGLYSDLFSEGSRKSDNKTTTGKAVKSLSSNAPRAARIKYHQRNSPFRQAIQDLYSTSALVSKNEAHKALFNMAKKYKSKEVWEVYESPFTRDKDGNLAAHDLTNTVPVYIDGKTKYVKLHSKPLQWAWKNRKEQPLWNWLSKPLNTINSYLRNIYTVLNPEFAMVNKVRDLQDALFNLSEEDSGRIIRKFAAYQTRAMSAVAGYEVGKDTEGTRLMEEMMANGGFVSWANYSNVKGLAKQLEDASNEFHRRSSKNPLRIPGKTLRLGVKGLDVFNAMMEQSTRLSIYKAVRDTRVESLRSSNPEFKGKTIEQMEVINPEAIKEIRLEAAKASKNVTINFNKKGTAGAWLNTLYLFSNAGIQAAVKPFKVLGKKGAKAPKALGTLAFTGGIAYKMWLNAMLDDDEMAELLNEYDYENNIIIPIDIENGLVFTLPKSYGGFRVLWNTGEAIADSFHTGDWSSLFSSMSNEAYQVVNPISGSYNGSWVSGIMPTVVRPGVEVATNLNYQGNYIAPHKYDQFAGDHETTKAKTPQGFKDFASFMYETVGVDAHPETYKHWFDSYVSGVWSAGARTISPLIPEDSWLKEQEEKVFGDKYQKEGWYNSPGLRRFFKNVKEEEWRETNKMYEASEKLIVIKDNKIEDVVAYGKAIKKNLDKELIDEKKAKGMISKYKSSVRTAYKKGSISEEKAEKLFEAFEKSLK